MTTAGRVRRALLATLVLAGIGLTTAMPSSAQTNDDDLPEGRAGEAGTNTALPRTESAVTKNGTGEFADLAVTVNQTKDLGNQTVSITWTGGEPTVRAGVDFPEHFLQIMQCWSEPGASGPHPEQCEFGATDAVVGGRNSVLFGPGYADDRIISETDFENFDPDAGIVESEDRPVQWMPFRAVTGEEIGVHIDIDFSPSVESGEYWLNPFFNVITTNEIVGARTRPDGTGEELFEVQTGQEANGLGCGQRVLGTGDDAEIPDCWLVIVPRGSAVDENAGTKPGASWEENPFVATSPLAASAWANRIVVPLEFNPVDSPCDINAQQRRIVGSEVLLRAVRSWQPVLCSTPGFPPYGYTPLADSLARRQLVAHAPSSPGMAVTPRPIPPAQIAEDDAVVFAPLTLSSMVVAFNVERVPDVIDGGPEIAELKGIRVADINLTPRLVAKLLTQSYQSQVYIADKVPMDEDGEELDGYEWVEENPRTLGQDPDFLRFNPEFQLLAMSSKNFGGLVLPIGVSDTSTDVWEWILADPEASEWMAGEPDEWDMAVNPAYDTTAEGNSSGIPFGQPVPDIFPKSEPNCYQAPPVGPTRLEPAPLCGTDWLPYASTLREAGQRTRAANDAARANLNTAATVAGSIWRANGPQPAGQRAILSITDSASAAQYGLQVARLSRAGDNDDERRFIAPDDAGVRAGLQAMTESEDVDGFLVPDPEADAPDAYPLTVLNYAAVTPLHLDEKARTEYADFVDYVVGEGQEPGLELGQLPPGYTQLPEELRAQARAGAVAIRTLQPSGATTTTTATTAPSTTTTAPAPTTTRASGGTRTPTTAPPTTAAPTTTVAPVVAAGGDRPSTTTTTEAPEPGMTPAVAVGGIRFALPFLAGLALLAGLLALEITKRPRRALTGPGGTTTPVIVLVLAASVLGAALLASAGAPASAQESGSTVEGRHLGLTTTGGDDLDGGGSATQFNVDLEGTDECPGDSEHDDFRIMTFMVPASLAAEDIVWNGEGPSPRTLETYDAFRLPLFDVDTNEVTAGLTLRWEVEDGPGAIPQLPSLSFGVYGPGELPVGAYRIGVACVLHNELFRYWDTEIDVTADESDPSGFVWAVTGSGSTGGGDSDSSPLPFVIGGGVVLLAIVALLVRRRTKPSAPSALEHA